VADEPERTGTSDAPKATRGLAALTWQKTTVVALFAAPGVLAVHAAVWRLMRVFGDSNEWVWGRETLSALFVSFGTFFVLRWWLRRAAWTRD
jgi:hypothetical protein